MSRSAVPWTRWGDPAAREDPRRGPVQAGATLAPLGGRSWRLARRLEALLPVSAAPGGQCETAVGRVGCARQLLLRSVRCPRHGGQYGRTVNEGLSPALVNLSSAGHCTSFTSQTVTFAAAADYYHQVSDHRPLADLQFREKTSRLATDAHFRDSGVPITSSLSPSPSLGPGPSRR